MDLIQMMSKAHDIETLIKMTSTPVPYYSSDYSSDIITHECDSDCDSVENDEKEQETQTPSSQEPC